MERMVSTRTSPRFRPLDSLWNIWLPFETDVLEYHCSTRQLLLCQPMGPEYEASKAIEYINKQKDQKQPFALVVSMNPPHTGYELVPDRYKEIYKDLDVEALCKGRPDIPAKGTEMGDYFRNNIRNYYACITGVDENVGESSRPLNKIIYLIIRSCLYLWPWNLYGVLTKMPEKISSMKSLCVSPWFYLGRIK